MIQNSSPCFWNWDGPVGEHDQDMNSISSQDDLEQKPEVSITIFGNVNTPLQSCAECRLREVFTPICYIPKVTAVTNKTVRSANMIKVMNPSFCQSSRPFHMEYIQYCRRCLWILVCKLDSSLI